MASLAKKTRDNFNKDPLNRIGLDNLMNDINRFSNKILDKYEGNDEIRTNCSKYALPSIILSACKERLNETDIKEVANKIIKVLCGEKYPNLKVDLPDGLIQAEIDLIKEINNFSPFKKLEIGKAVELCLSNEILGDEPLGCYVRPGILKVTHNVPEFVDHPKIVLYKEKIDEFAESKNISQEYITAFVYLYQLCRMYFDRYPYGNLLEYKEWDVKEDRLRGVVKIDVGKIQDSIVRDDKVSSVERPIVALAALHYANQINKVVLKAGMSILSDEELYLKWPKLKEWNNVGLDLYKKGNKELIDTYRNVAILISSDDDLIRLINDKASLLKRD